jgi:hypothetical protein
LSYPVSSLFLNDGQGGFGMKIDCTQCEMYHSEHCADCLVTALLHPPEVQLDIDQDLDPSLEALTGAGLIPVLKFRPRAAPAPSEAASEPSSEAG